MRDVLLISLQLWLRCIVLNRLRRSGCPQCASNIKAEAIPIKLELPWVVGLANIMHPCGMGWLEISGLATT